MKGTIVKYQTLRLLAIPLLVCAFHVCADDTNDFPVVVVNGQTLTNVYVATFNATTAWLYQRTGGGGQFKLSDLPPEVQARCHYNPVIEARLNAQAEAAAHARQEAIRAADTIANVYRYTGELWDNSFGWRRFPHRIVGNQVVNLSALTNWWNHAYELAELTPARGRNQTNAYGSNYLSHLPARPLTNWFRVYGEKVGEDRTGWIVQGKIENAPGYSRTAKFELQTPPNDDKNRFDELQASLAELNRQGGLNGNPRYFAATSAVQYGNGTTELKGVPINPVLHALAEPIWAELDTMPPGTNYHVDFFAVKKGYQRDGAHLEVFDLGQIR
jgi:hypothetical protein